MSTTSSLAWTAAILLASYTHTFAQARSLAEQFPVVDAEHSLYAVKGLEGYVLQDWSRNCASIDRVKVVPQFFFEQYHPQWIRPDKTMGMSLAKYEYTLQRISLVKPIGNLSKQGHIGTMFNLKLNFTDEYDSAMIERAMFRNSPDEDYKVAWFKVYFFRPVRGKIEAKDTGAFNGTFLSGFDGTFRIRVAGDWYWVKEAVFKSVTVGDETVIDAAGPIGDEADE